MKVSSTRSNGSKKIGGRVVREYVGVSLLVYERRPSVFS
jgi:hypothetical protein